MNGTGGDPSQHPIRIGLDMLAAGAVFGTIVSWLPPISAALGIIWFLIQIWESRTVQAFVDKHMRHSKKEI